MYLASADSQLVLSPSDLNGFVSCPHLTTLELARLAGEVEDERVRGAEADLLARKGDEHELAYLAQLEADGSEVVRIPDADDNSLRSLRETARFTEEAMRRGTEVIYQGTFLAELELEGATHHFRGHTDFLFRVDDRPSDLGSWSYEVADTKLARRAKPYFILQLCFYSELLERVQGTSPERIHVVLGDPGKTMESYRLVEFSAYFRRIRSRFLRVLVERPETYPEPCEHCSVCAWRERCEGQREADDHLSLVAGITGRQREKLVEAGVSTLAALGELEPNEQISGIREPTLAKLRSQAALQLAARDMPDGDPPPIEILPPEKGRGLARLPEPSPGDIFFDIEGDPFFESGLEYLLGVITRDHSPPDPPAFEAIWGTDRAMEKRATERFIDLVVERRRGWPDLHVYHYNHYEVTALKRLTSSHGTREEELDDLLRAGVFVDLLKVVREGLRIGLPGYGLKLVESCFMAAGRGTEVTDGGESVVEFERWLDGGGVDDSILRAIADYNEYDCVSTLELRGWLLAIHPRAEDQYGVEIGYFEGSVDGDEGEPGAAEGPAEALQAELLATLPEDREGWSGDQRSLWLLAQLLTYHRREERPVWWAFFDRADADPETLIEDVDCVGALEAAPGAAPEPEKQSQKLTMRFPTQETKVREGSYVDPAGVDEKLPGVHVLAIDADAGELVLKRGPTHAGRPWPAAIAPGGPYRADPQKGALQRIATQVLERGLEESGRYHAMLDMLLRRPPRVDGIEAGEPLHPDPATLEELQRVVRGLDESYLMIQGPPGSGKTWSGARLIVDLIDEGKRVGVASTSHKAIHNMLDEIEAVAVKRRVKFHGLKKSSGEESEFDSATGMIESVNSNSALTNPEVALTAGTAWHYAREEVDSTLDYLFIDEAGQISLADAMALGASARNVVLLGDPQQLPQVSQGRHPAGAGASVMEHLLGDRQTISPDRGVFLGETWRMCPEITEFISELMYDGRLAAAPGRELQCVAANGALSGAGTRWLPVDHTGNAQSSIEEAEAIAAALDDLLDRGTYVDCEGAEHPLTGEDILVVTPFNSQVRCLQERLPADARIGTVDKFQGQSAQVVLFSMASSTGEDLPRGIEFLFSRNRLNVAMSRARCLAVLVCSPALLDVGCRSVEQMRLVNAVCRVAEGARDG